MPDQRRTLETGTDADRLDWLKRAERWIKHPQQWDQLRGYPESFDVICAFNICYSKPSAVNVVALYDLLQRYKPADNA